MCDLSVKCSGVCWKDRCADSVTECWVIDYSDLYEFFTFDELSVAESLS